MKIEAMDEPREEQSTALVPQSTALVPAYPNLKPFQKGKSGNPAGRPPRKSLRKLIQEVGATRDKRLIKKMYELALAGDVRAGEWIAKFGTEPISLEVTTREFTIVLAQPNVDDE